MEEKELLNAADAATRLHVAKRTILRWAREGKIGYVRVSRKVILFTGEAIDKFLQNRAFDVESPTTNHKEAGRKMTSPKTKKGGGKKTSGELSGNLRKEVLSWL
ncbi:MAG: helix-turn-helix domain-containing protein [Desulfomonilaceae bacterium]